MLIERKVPDSIRLVNRRARRSLRVSPPREARSLDRNNQLATSVKNDSETFSEWLKSQTDARDKRRKLYSTHERLLESLQKAGHHLELLRHEAAIEATTRNELTWQTAYKKALGARWQPWKDFKRVQECQTSFIGFRAKCCDSKAIAVPVGCNHRLCPLCNSHRAEHYRGRIRQLFEIVGNPQLLTLTVPNCRKLTRQTFQALRKRLRAFLRDNKALLKGGVYSIECTYNRATEMWHPHIHVLVDVDDPRQEISYREFCERKWRLEFDWFVLTQGPRVEGKRRWRKHDYQEWLCGVDPDRTGWYTRAGMTYKTKKYPGPFGGGDFDRTGQRRTIDLRTVTSDKKAAYEVLKYMTKVVGFVDDHHAVSEFLSAVKGVRAIQTFGSCYGFKLEDPPVEAHLQCECGANEFERIGMLGLGNTIMTPEGKWYVRDDAPLHGRQRCRGSDPPHERKHHGSHRTKA